MTGDPGLRFWLEYCERSGGVWEEAGDRAVVLLPPSLRATLGLPEEVAVTADPEVAEEDGALLLTPGHPVLERAAAEVLQGGDAGYGFLPWPRSQMPEAAALLQRARDALDVEHGRIDAAGDAVPVHLPVLRAVVLVTYAADQQFQELEEVWADGRTGMALGADAVRRLAALPPAPAAEGPPELARSPALQPDLEAGLSGALGLVDARAAARARVLGDAAQVALRGEARRAEAYYDDLLASIARRRAAAPPERQALLEAQAGATAAERGRRLAEIEDKARVRHELRPVRLHLLLVPALHLPLEVRRGAQTFPFALVWMPPAMAFAPVRCPHCGREAPLVAGRERLGCRSCLARPAEAGAGAGTGAGAGAKAGAGAGAAVEAGGQPAAGAARQPAGARREGAGAAGLLPAAPAREAGAAAAAAGGAPAGQGPGGRSEAAPPPDGPVAAGAAAGPAPGAGGVPPGREPAGRPDARPAAAQAAGAGRSGSALPGRGPARARYAGHEQDLARLLQQPAAAGERAVKEMRRLLADFWGAAARGSPWPRAGLDRGAPLQTLYRLYGGRGALVAVGLPAGVPPERTTIGLPVPGPGGALAASGAVSSRGSEYPYTLRWRTEGGAQLLVELVPVAGAFGWRLPDDPAEVFATDRLHAAAPAPQAGLDGVEAVLWREETRRAGMPFAVRCLTLWERAKARGAGASGSPEALAAAAAGFVASCAGPRRTQAVLGQQYGVSAASVALASKDIRAALGEDRPGPW